VEWTPNQKGAIAEAAVALGATRAGIPVFKPIFEDRRYDFVFEAPTGLLRVQVKWARERRGAVLVIARTSRIVTGGRFERTTYSTDEVDAVAVYCPDTECCYFIPIFDIPASGCMSLRLTQAKNNQLKGLHSAAEYELNLGAIAQLGERRHGMAEVVGSSPTSSTPQEPRIARLFA
jgi:hypothetical protein